MTQANVYLTFNGNCHDAFTYYQSVFGGEFQSIQYFRDMPPQEGMPPLSSEDMNKVMHVSLPLDGGSVLMGSDTAGPWAEDFAAGNNFSISIYTDSREKADLYFAALSAKGKVTMPMAETFWKSYFGMCTDPFGIQWMLNVNM